MGTRSGARKTSKTTHQFGTIRRLRSGRYQARYTGPNRQRYTAGKTFPTELDAYAWLAEVRHSIDTGCWQPPTKTPPPEPVEPPTVGQTVEHWLTTTQRQVRDSTYQTYLAVLANRVLNDTTLATVRVDQLTTPQIAAWWARTQATYPNTPTRNNHAYSKLRAALALAVEDGHIPYNPVNLRATTRKKPTPRKQLPTTSDLRAILDAMPHRYRLVTVLCLFHGLRIGEALALKRKNITPDPTTVTVDSTLVRVTGPNGRTTMQLHEPKTPAGYRAVPIAPEFRPILRDHLATYHGGPDDYATTTEAGNPVFDTSYRSIFNRARDLAGANPNITPHYGRVYVTTRLAEAGATPREIGLLLGQTDVTTITSIYMRAHEQRAANIMQNLAYD